MLVAFNNPSGPTRETQEFTAKESYVLLNSASLTQDLGGNHQAGTLHQGGTEQSVRA